MRFKKQYHDNDCDEEEIEDAIIERQVEGDDCS
jgi:hypothetical protein